MLFYFMLVFFVYLGLIFYKANKNTRHVMVNTISISRKKIKILRSFTFQISTLKTFQSALISCLK
ncbi:hypothetical protein PB1_11264 [Bacillus methanolicus PB1]|uniref:Uncharacterized protein n=1 Tax=Bacillus methanolicus PB1 TaxID=997296 RepID=I3DV64_BACMT|nr:hypothetical protein PB1_11264 [Bacillus methanolicus PB1]